jgi:hypothetical protein
VEAKVCTACGEAKPLDAFGRQPGGKLGLHPRCRACRNAQERARYRENRDRILEQNRVSGAKQEWRRQRWRWRKYRLTEDDYLAMVEVQGGRCAICGRADEALCVDHDHATGRVRLLLCKLCNVGLGAFGDDPARCELAAAYLRAHAVDAPRGQR